MWSALFVCLSLCLSICLWAVLLAKESADFIETWFYDWACQSEELVNFWQRSGPGYGFRIAFHFSHHCRIGYFSWFVSISHDTVTSWFLRYLVKWLTPTTEWIQYILGAIRQTSGSRLIQKSGFKNPEHSCLRFWHWRRFAPSKYSLVFKRFKIIDGWVSAPDSLDTLVGQGRGRVR